MPAHAARQTAGLTFPVPCSPFPLRFPQHRAIPTPMKASDVKKGNVVEHDGTVYQVRDIERSAPTARGGNVTFRFTMYSIPGGRKFDLSLRADDDLKEMDLVRQIGRAH